MSLLKRYLRKIIKKRHYTLQKHVIDRLGSDYGKASVISSLLGPQSIVYSVGIGEEISFDEQLMKKTGCAIFGFDPTPRAKTFAESKKKELDHFSFVNVGLAGETGTKTFYFHENSEFVSMSLTQDSGAGSMDAEFLTLADAMQQLGHSWVDFMKLDIEGEEYNLFETWLELGYEPPVGQIWIEFHDADRASRPHVDAPLLGRQLVQLGFLPLFNAADNGMLLLNTKSDRVMLMPFCEGRDLCLATWSN